jgi:hypothetical protein
MEKAGHWPIADRASAGVAAVDVLVAHHSYPRKPCLRAARNFQLKPPKISE